MRKILSLLTVISLACLAQAYAISSPTSGLKSVTMSPSGENGGITLIVVVVPPQDKVIREVVAVFYDRNTGLSMDGPHKHLTKSGQDTYTYSDPITFRPPVPFKDLAVRPGQWELRIYANYTDWKQDVYRSEIDFQISFITPASPILPPLPQSVGVKIKAQTEKIVYDIYDPVVATVEVDNSDNPYVIEPKSVTYELYRQNYDLLNNEVRDANLVGKGSLVMLKIKQANALTFDIPAGAAAFISGGEVFSYITHPANPATFSPRTPHPEDLYAMRIRFTGKNKTSGAEVIGETYLGFKIEAKR